MADRDSPSRRLTGVEWLVDVAFHENLLALLAMPGETAAKLARDLSAAMGEDVEVSGVSRLKNPASIGTGSVLVGPICKLKGWPVPPLANSEREGEWGTDAAWMYELQGDPSRLKEIREAIRESVISLRKVRQLRRGTPENTED